MTPLPYIAAPAPVDVEVDRSGDLRIDGRVIARHALPELAFYATTIVFPSDTGAGTDLLVLWRKDALPEPLIAWPGTEDRPSFSPDGDSLAFVASTDGLPSVWMLDLASREATRLTNQGLRRTPGRAPEGFVPPPDSPRFMWSADRLSWTANGVAYSVARP